MIAVDGPAAAGKGTLARRLAAHYGLPHLDTGLLYRAVGLRALREGMDPVAAAEALTLADLAEPGAPRGQRRPGGLEGGGDPGGAGGPPGARSAASRPSPPARCWTGGISARWSARSADQDLRRLPAPEARARRRHEELRERGRASIYARVLQDMRERDARDRGRAVAPLTRRRMPSSSTPPSSMPMQVFARALGLYRAVSCRASPPG